MRVAIVSVSKVSKEKVYDFMESLNFKPTEIITGGKGGGVWWTESWAGSEIPIMRCEPDFKLNGRKRAVPKAQDKMIFECDALVAFHDRKSKMVEGMIKYALHQKKKVFICYVPRVKRTCKQKLHKEL